MNTTPLTPPTEPKPIAAEPNARWWPLLGVLAVAIALVGFWGGVNQPRLPTRSPESHPVVATGPVLRVPSYRDLREGSRGVNRDWASNFDKFKQERPGLFDVVVKSPELKAAAILDRTRTRAFEGAPPVVPHPIVQQSAQSCLVCHGEGLKLGDKLATRISHAHFTSCTQCHVEAETSGPFDAVIAGASGYENTFTGIERSGPGTRAMGGSPPQIPHTMWLREDCTSCHGLVARPGLRTSHPWLSNCVQCHAPSAELDRVPFGSVTLSETDSK